MSDEAREKWRIPSGIWVIAIVVVAGAALTWIVSIGLSLPAFFIAMASVTLLLALLSLWQGLRAAFGDAAATASLRRGLPERAALLDEKNALLRAIKDIEFERQVGKLSDEEFERLDKSYRRRAKEVLRKLDEDLAPYMTRAQRILDDATRREPDGEAKRPSSKKRGKKGGKGPIEVAVCPSCGAANDAAADRCAACSARIAPVSCAACGAANEPDARSCKRCGASIGEAEPPPAASEERE